MRGLGCCTELMHAGRQAEWDIMGVMDQASYHGLLTHQVVLLLLLPFVPGEALGCEGCNASSVPFR